MSNLPALPSFARLQAAARRLPAFTVPPALGRLVARLPQQPPALALSLALNLALGRILPREDLAPLTGRRLRLRVTDAGLTLDFGLGARGFRPLPATGTPDLTLSATVRDYLALALREEDADTLFFSRRLIMEGDTDLGLLVKNTLDAVDWDALTTAWSPAALLARLPLPGRPRRPAGA
ncbi:SCP2 sterol-binding domain-containing protein [Thauera sp. CAU 1555]|uniref:Ubiquinone biosynthesis accessory factor UbiT n=1 Tax=Thauera sedimentorum TaxID=2767595 RepID=A0ABR9BAH4_9RHOO|nr:SCP2 sterol-binding domain-containing protein [Thauera sedimentorum]MBC9072430.1 SCP2 sterol-binding domain-containing protein [Thauera sedimentorum]MBD8503349.1 SCP2 sterol-binding domain-containing protein [Thauera sedimentorum]